MTRYYIEEYVANLQYVLLNTENVFYLVAYM